MRVIALSSVPPRFGMVGPVLESLVAQGADHVLFVLPRRFARFPGPVVPPSLPKGVTRVDCEDYGPLTKLLPAARLFPDATLTLCDDDCVYESGWLNHLTGASEGIALAGSAFSVSRIKRRGVEAPYFDIAQGFAGITLPARLVDVDWATPPDFARAVDDLWISGHLARLGWRIKAVPAARKCVRQLERPANLQDARAFGWTRADANAATAQWFSDQFGIWPKA